MALDENYTSSIFIRWNSKPRNFRLPPNGVKADMRCFGLYVGDVTVYQQKEIDSKIIDFDVDYLLSKIESAVGKCAKSERERNNNEALESAARNRLAAVLIEAAKRVIEGEPIYSDNSPSLVLPPIDFYSRDIEDKWFEYLLSTELFKDGQVNIDAYADKQSNEMMEGEGIG